jgi:hypothetical protein
MVCGGWVSRLVAAEPTDDAVRQARLDFVRDRFLSWTLTLEGESPRVLEPQRDPLIRFTNPIVADVNDGTLFIWRDGPRPVAACSYSMRGPKSPPDVYFEFTQLDDRPMRLTLEQRTRLTPQRGPLVNQPLSWEGALPDKPAARLSAMRQQAKRFTASEYDDVTNQTSELRLLPQPMDRYAAPEQGILDGALFALVVANDPQLLLRLEIVTNATKEPEWRYSLARMASQTLNVQLDGRELIEIPRYWRNPKPRTDPYLETADGVYDVVEPTVVP